MPERDNRNHSFDAIPVQQIVSYDLSHTEIIPMYDIPSRSQASLEERLREIVMTRCWWLEKEWQEKSVREQFDFFLPSGKTFSVYNYGKELSAQEIESLQRAVDGYAQIRGGRALELAKNIVINNQERTELGKLGGGMQFGRAHRANMDQKRDLATGHVVQLDDPTSTSFIEINPQARIVPAHVATYGFTPVSHFEGTIIHELGHLLENNLAREWARRTGWRLSGDPRAYPVDNPPPTRYGMLGHDEDFAESMVHYLCHPDFALYLRHNGTPTQRQAWEVRRAFLAEYIGDPPSARKNIRIPLTRKTGKEIAIPRLPESIYYALVKEMPNLVPIERKSKLISIRKIALNLPLEDQKIQQARAHVDAMTASKQKLQEDDLSRKDIPHRESQQTGIGKFLTFLQKILIGETIEKRNERYGKIHSELQEAKRKKRVKKKS